MLRNVLFIILMFLGISSTVLADVYVRGYTRQDGSYVQPHRRTNPDSNPYNNYSSPNYNSNYYNSYDTGTRYNQLNGEPDYDY